VGLKPFKVDSSEKGILTREELMKLFKEENRDHIWPEELHFIINYLAASTGLRIGEILALRTKSISNNQLIVTNSYSPEDGLKSTKNGKTRIIPLNQKLKDMLVDLCKGKQDDAFLFSSSNGQKPMCHKTIYRRFWHALEIVGISKEERKRRNITFHSYRHGVNTMLLEKGLLPETVRLMLGHSAPSMTAHYSHIQLPDIIKIQENSTLQCEEVNNNTHIPSYINSLIDKGLLYPDGKRVVKSLDSVALEINDMKIRPTEKLLMELFLKVNGDKYSIKACKKAMLFANY
jgi:integrase